MPDQPRHPRDNRHDNDASHGTRHARPDRAGAALTWLPDWPVRWMLRRHGLPDIPEVRRLLRASWRKGFTFGAAPGHREMRAIRKEALAAVIRTLPDDEAVMNDDTGSQPHQHPARL